MLKRRTLKKRNNRNGYSLHKILSRWLGSHHMLAFEIEAEGSGAIMANVKKALYKRYPQVYAGRVEGGKWIP